MFHVGFVAKCAAVYLPGAAVILFVVGGPYWHLPSFRESVPVIAVAFFALMLAGAYVIYFVRRSKIELTLGTSFKHGWDAASFGMMLR
jgi:hypothetical protein